MVDRRKAYRPGSIDRREQGDRSVNRYRWHVKRLREGERMGCPHCGGVKGDHSEICDALTEG